MIRFRSLLVLVVVVCSVIGFAFLLLFFGIICWQIGIQITDDKGNVKEIGVPTPKKEIGVPPTPKKEIGVPTPRRVTDDKGNVKEEIEVPRRDSK